MTPTSQPRVEPDFEEARKIALDWTREQDAVAITLADLKLVGHAYLALLARAEAAEEQAKRLEALIDGEGPQIAMGTAAGLLKREIAAREAAEERERQLRGEVRVLEELCDAKTKRERGLAEFVKLVSGDRNDGGFSPTEVKPVKLRRLAREALAEHHPEAGAQ